MQYTQRAWQFISQLIGSHPGEEAWIDDITALNPREQVIWRMTQIVQWVAIFNLGALLLLTAALLLGIVPASQMGTWLCGGWSGTANTMTLLGLVGILANIALLLLLATAASAQEFWTWLLCALLVAGNLWALIRWQFYPALLTVLPLIWVIRLMLKEWRAFHFNAVSVKELRGRMRGARSFAIITIFLVLMGSFVVLLYLMQLPRLNATDVIITGNLGQLLFFGVVGMELLLIVFIVPALTAGAITGERERKTYDLLQTTLLSAPTFIMGKMESALSYIVLLLLSAIPLQSIAFLFGGVSQIEVLVTFVLLMASAFVLGAMGMFFSAVVERTMSATVRVYTVAIVLVFALPLVSTFVFQGAFVAAINQVALISQQDPFWQALMIYGDMIWSSLNPILSAYYTQQMIVAQQELFLLQVELQNNTFIPVIAPWLLTTLFYISGGAWLLLLAVRRMRRGI